MNKALGVDQELCSGCGLCQSGCNLKKTGMAGLSAAGVSVARPAAGEGIVLACNHCEEPLCVTACLMEAITKSPDGLVARNEEACIGCQSCVVMCPWEACRHDDRRDVAVSCDLCGGEPYCVSLCPTCALTLAAPGDVSRNRRQAAVRRLHAT